MQVYGTIGSESSSSSTNLNVSAISASSSTCNKWLNAVNQRWPNCQFTNESSKRWQTGHWSHSESHHERVQTTTETMLPKIEKFEVCKFRKANQPVRCLKAKSRDHTNKECRSQQIRDQVHHRWNQPLQTHTHQPQQDETNLIDGSVR